MIDSINITNVQAVEITGHAPRPHNKTNVRYLHITYGESDDVTVIKLSSDGDDVPIILEDKTGQRHFVYDDSD